MHFTIAGVAFCFVDFVVYDVDDDSIWEITEL